MTERLVGVWIPSDRADLQSCMAAHGKVVKIIREIEYDLENILKSHPNMTARASMEWMFCYEVEINNQRVIIPSEHVYDIPDDSKCGDSIFINRNITGERSDGIAIGDSYEIKFGGNCPIQGFGQVDGLACYYRARGSGWSLEIYGMSLDEFKKYELLPDDDKCIWNIHKHEYVWPDGGWLNADISVKNIERAVVEFRKWRNK